MVEGKNQHLQLSSDLHNYAMIWTSADMQKIKKNVVPFIANNNVK